MSTRSIRAAAARSAANAPVVAASRETTATTGAAQDGPVAQRLRSRPAFSTAMKSTAAPNPTRLLRTTRYETARKAPTRTGMIQSGAVIRVSRCTASRLPLGKRRSPLDDDPPVAAST
ncbi:hypothetical protein ADL06_13665 [Streptomyces sp. NRRL F-6491]|nr:hypothetical protein ADL06_13665 [Streptomyces sp. NRRL F-6491]KOX41913.1 hypothetical protein ADL08_17735 [Streptomyces sp. NRRL F-6492]